MDFSFTDEQELLKESIAEFCERYVDEKDIPAMYENHGTPHDLDMAYLEAGFGLMGLPEEYGGIPCDMVTLGMLTEEFVHNAGFTAPYLNATLALRDMVDFGSDEQIKMCFDAYQETGKPIFSLGFSEPGAGSDNQNMSSVARRQPDGTYLLNGQKTWVTNGENFPLVLLIAKDEDPSRDNREMSMWLVPLDTPGLTTAPLHKIGQQIMPFCDMYFDDVVLTEDMRVGKKGEGFKNLMKNFEVERLTICAANVGMARCAYDEAVRYAGVREQFGKTIGSFQLIQEKIVDMKIKIENMQNMLYKTAWKKMNGESIMIDSSLVKRYTGQAAFEVIDDAMQIMGGIGYTHDCRISRLWRDQRVYRIMAGTEEIMVHTAGRALIKEAQ